MSHQPALPGANPCSAPSPAPVTSDTKIGTGGGTGPSTLHGPGTPERDSLRLHRAGELVARKRDVIDAEAHMSVWDALKKMHTNDILALPVYGQHGHWIAAGGVSATRDSTVRQGKVYIGIIGLSDIGRWLLNFPTPWKSLADLRALLDSTQISGLIGQTPESRSLWIAPSDASLVCVLEPLAKGLHRWLVESASGSAADTVVPMPIHDPHHHLSSSSADHQPMKLVPAGSTLHDYPSTFRVATQTDLVRFIHANRPSFPAINRLAQQALARVLPEKATEASVVSVTQRTLALKALQLLASSLLNALAVTDDATGHVLGQWTWSVVRDPDTLVRILVDPQVVVGQLVPDADLVGTPATRVVTVCANDTLEDALDRIVYAGAHRAWVVEGLQASLGQQAVGRPVGVVTLTDVLRACLTVTMHED